MAIYFPHSKTLLTLIPKTGGTWMQTAVEEIGLRHEHRGRKHSSFHDLRNTDGIEKVMLFDREPVSWAKSYYYMKQQGARETKRRASYRNPARVMPRWWPVEMDDICILPLAEYLPKAVHIYENIIFPQYTNYILSAGKVPLIAMFDKKALPETFSYMLARTGEIDQTDRFKFRRIPPVNIGNYDDNN